MGCQNGTSGTSSSHSLKDVKTDHGRAISRIVRGVRPAVQRPKSPKKTTAQEKSAHWWKAIPAMVVVQDGSISSIRSRNGIVATDIQSTTASRPIRVAV